jgi:hypothetical protein
MGTAKSVEYISNYCKNNSAKLDEKYKLAKLKIGKEKRVSFIKQFRLLFKRNTLHIIRNPLSSIALIGLAFYMAFLVSSLYYGVGNKKIDIVDSTQNAVAIQNWIGLAFFLSSNSFVSMSFA